MTRDHTIHLQCSQLEVLFIMMLHCSLHSHICLHAHIYRTVLFPGPPPFEMISLTLTCPYKDGCGWWAPFELLRRYVFLIAVIFNPGCLVGILIVNTKGTYLYCVDIGTIMSSLQNSGALNVQLICYHSFFSVPPS